MLRDSFVIGLMLSVSLDFLLKQGLVSTLICILNYDGTYETGCTTKCLTEFSVFLWGLVAIIKFIYECFRTGLFRNLFTSSSINRGQYSPVPTGIAGAQAESQQSSYQQRTFSYPDTLVFNYVDPDDIPELLKPYAESIFTLSMTVLKVHGFQVDNCRNQAEHLIMLLLMKPNLWIK